MIIINHKKICKLSCSLIPKFMNTRAVLKIHCDARFYCTDKGDSQTTTTNNGKIPIEKKGRVLILGGPTGVGKSELSLLLARRLNGEIICCDSTTVFKNVNIGTNKLKPSEMKGIPHHLLDIFHFNEEINVNQFCKRSKQITEDILSRGKVPIIVAGSGFWTESFIYGVSDGPPNNKDASRELEKELRALPSWEEALKVVEKFDPVIVKSITQNNYKRLARAYAASKLNGEPFSNYMRDVYQTPESDLLYDFRCFFLAPSRPLLIQQIDRRCEDMIRAGLIKEVTQLLIDGLDYNKSHIATTVGYKQTIDYLLNTKLTEVDVKSFKDFLEYFFVASRQVVHKQFAWFKRMKIFRWIKSPVLTASYQGEDAELLQTYLDYLVDEISSLYNLPYQEYVQYFDTKQQEPLKRMEKEEEEIMKRYSSMSQILKSRQELAQMLRIVADSIDKLEKAGVKKSEKN